MTFDPPRTANPRNPRTEPALTLSLALLLAQGIGGYLEGHDQGDDDCEVLPT